MARCSSIVAALALCLLLSSATGGYARGFKFGFFRSRIQASRGHGSGPGGSHGHGRHGHLIYNSSLVANLTDSSSTRIGGVSLSLFLNNDTGDYDLTFKLVSRIPAGDSPASASVLASDNSTLFSLVGLNGFSSHGNWSSTAGVYRNLSTLTTAAGKAYLAAVQEMIAAPATFTAQLISTLAPAGLASGAFEASADGGFDGYHGGHGGRGHGGHGQHQSNLIYNITLLANLTNASNKVIGMVALNLFQNNLTSDYDLSYGAGLFVSQGDAPTSALVSSSSSSPLFNITNAKGFFHLGNLYITGGMFHNITTIALPAGGSLYDAVESIVAAPASFTAQVQSVQAAAGVASGPFIAKVFNSTQHHSGNRRGNRRGNRLLDMIMRPTV